MLEKPVFLFPLRETKNEKYDLFFVSILIVQDLEVSFWSVHPTCNESNLVATLF